MKKILVSVFGYVQAKRTAWQQARIAAHPATRITKRLEQQQKQVYVSWVHDLKLFGKDSREIDLKHYNQMIALNNALVLIEHDYPAITVNHLDIDNQQKLAHTEAGITVTKTTKLGTPAPCAVPANQKRPATPAPPVSGGQPQ